MIYLGTQGAFVMNELSARQKQILNYIKQEVELRGYPPSVREIGKAVGLQSSSTVHAHLRKLESLGYIRRDPTKPRAIEILETHNYGLIPRPSVLNVPIVGKVTAGSPILAQENIEDYFPIPKDFINHDDVFMLRIQGDSMIDAGIFDKDYVLVERRSTANNGDIVVALLGDEATVKRFFLEKSAVRLQPENPSMSPIITNDVQILGKVIGVFRRVH